MSSLKKNNKTRELEETKKFKKSKKKINKLVVKGVKERIGGANNRRIGGG